MLSATIAALTAIAVTAKPAHVASADSKASADGPRSRRRSFPSCTSALGRSVSAAAGGPLPRGDCIMTCRMPPGELPGCMASPTIDCRDGSVGATHAVLRHRGAAALCST